MFKSKPITKPSAVVYEVNAILGFVGFTVGVFTEDRLPSIRRGAARRKLRIDVQSHRLNRARWPAERA